MSQGVSVFVSTRQVSQDSVELVLEAMDGSDDRWSKVYDGALFLSMDAQSLGLLELAPNPPGGGGPRNRLKRSGHVEPEQLARMRFAHQREREDSKG